MKARRRKIEFLAHVVAIDVFQHQISAKSARKLSRVTKPGVFICTQMVGANLFTDTQYVGGDCALIRALNFLSKCCFHEQLSKQISNCRVNENQSHSQELSKSSFYLLSTNSAE